MRDDINIEVMLNRIPVREGRSDVDRYELTNEDRKALQQTMLSPGYRVLLNVQEAACIEQQTKQINLPVETSNEIVVAYQRTTKAMWQFFVRWQKRAKHEVAELYRPAEPEMSEEDEVLDPTK